MSRLIELLSPRPLSVVAKLVYLVPNEVPCDALSKEKQYVTLGCRY